MQKTEQPEHLYRSGGFMAGLTMVLICFMFGVRWAWNRPQTPVGYVAPSPTPTSNPNERIEYLEGSIILRIPITPTPDTSKVRQLRDLRRYSTPITINNPQQVNIAADGRQQLNSVNRGEGES